MNLVILLEKYGFLIVLLYCIGWFTPNLETKLVLMDSNAMETLKEISGSNITKQVFWLTIFSFFFWRMIRNNILTKQKALYLFSIIIMCVFALTSTLWSEAPSSTLKRSIFQLIFCFTVIMSFYYAVFHRTVLNSLQMSTFLILAMTFVTIILGSAITSYGELSSFANTKNLFGQSLLAILILFLVYLNTNNVHWSKYKYSLFFLTLMLIMTVSKTSIFLFFIFLLVASLQPSLIKIITSTSFTFLFMFLIAIPAISYFLNSPFNIGLLVDDSFFTGRGIIWDTLYYDLMYFEKYSLGYGYGAYFGTGTIPWFFDDDWSFLKHIASSHNGYIDILLQFGFWGSALIFLLLFYMGYTLKLERKWIFAGLLVIIFYNFTESAFFRDQTMMWFLFLILFALNTISRGRETLNKQT